MKKFFLLAVLVTAFFIWLNRNDPAGPAAPQTVASPASLTPSPRPVSEHDWAKNSIDRARRVTDQVRRATSDAQQP
jgi:hypothetical protein